ncbi:MFS transporter [Leptolyngbya sp. AN02str]|uniref:MFS transporter n=1 Tax=Leptolyngbya sp. AN02str TaxID=3423363 RepID=UPI003D30FF48
MTIWLGQLVSTTGSYMTEFAIELWTWELTGSATALALAAFFAQLPRIPVTLVAGILVDRINRKLLMMLGDAIAALSTLAILLLYATDSLHIWHIYLISAVNGGFAQVQSLAYSTSLALIVPQQHYTRASSMDSIVHYGSAIVAPALAGLLYPVIGLVGIALIDLMTFAMAIATLLSISIPQPQPLTHQPVKSFAALASTLWQDMTFGVHYIWTHASLRALLGVTLLFWFAHDLGGAIYHPMLLARTNSDAAVLGSIASAAGIGGVTGGIVLSISGGPKRRVHGMLLGFIGAGLSKIVVGLGRSPVVWLPAQFCSSLNFPLLGSSETAIWMTQIAPDIQGRVFAANSLGLQVVSAIATLIAGPLGDRVFEPAMQSNSQLASLFSPIVGTGAGSGMALLYIMTSVGLLIVGISGYALPKLQQVEEGHPAQPNDVSS